jgi:hypothetical protein
LLHRKETLKEESVEKIVEKIIEKPVTVFKDVFHQYKRGTKKPHNSDSADPNIN